MEYIIQQFVDVQTILIQELIYHIQNIFGLDIGIQHFHDVLIDRKGEFVYNQIANFYNEYLNEIIMIEHKVDIDDLQRVHIEIDIGSHYSVFLATFKCIFHKINVDKMNMNVVSIKDIDKLDKNIHQGRNRHQQPGLYRYHLLLLMK